MLDRYRKLPLWRLAVYFVCIIGAIALLVWDVVDKSAQYTTVATVVLLAIAVLVRPGGIRGPRPRR
jgi:hypothetical protein